MIKKTTRILKYVKVCILLLEPCILYTTPPLYFASWLPSVLGASRGEATVMPSIVTLLQCVIGRWKRGEFCSVTESITRPCTCEQTACGVILGTKYGQGEGRGNVWQAWYRLDAHERRPRLGQRRAVLVRARHGPPVGAVAVDGPRARHAKARDVGDADEAQLFAKGLREKSSSQETLSSRHGPRAALKVLLSQR